MILAFIDDDVLALDGGKFETTSDRARRLYASKLLTRVPVDIDNGGIAEELHDAETPGARTRAVITALRAMTIRDDGDE